MYYTTIGEKSQEGDYMELAYRTMQEIVYDMIRNGILTGKYQSGQRLVASDLARELGVSRMPVREALQRLEVAGLVTMERHRAAIVSQLSEVEILEIYRIRAVLDGLATRLAAAHLTKDELGHLVELTNEMDLATQEGDLQKHLRANRDFHELIWHAAQSPRLMELLKNLYDTSQRLRSVSVLVPGHLEETVKNHRSIIDALLEGNVEKAEHLAVEHHEKTIRYLLSVVNANRKQPAQELHHS